MIIEYFLLGRIIIFSVLFFCDIMLTYFYMVKYRQIYSEDEEWHSAEGNIILKFCWKKWGLHIGTFFGVIFVYPIICLIILFTKVDFIFGMLIGIYLMVFMYNIHSLRDLLKDGKEKN
jgi:hypothetical protein